MIRYFNNGKTTDFNTLEDFIKHLDVMFIKKEIITVCCECHAIKDNGKFVRFEEWLEKRLNIKFSHGFCEACLEVCLKKNYTKNDKANPSNKQDLR